MARTTGTMLYDADCGFCARSASWVPRLGLTAYVDTIQRSGLNFDRDRAVREMPFVHEDGRVAYGHRAIAATLSTGARPWRLLALLMLLPGVDSLAAAVYRWVSQHRHRLPGGTAACELSRAPEA